MNRIFITVIFMLSTISGFSQIKISGRITLQTGGPVIGANVYLKDTYEGTISDTSGNFTFRSSLSGSQILIISFLGYETVEIPVELTGESLYIKSVLKENAASMDEVVCTAGVFEADDEKKSVILSTLDMASNPNGFGDIFSAVSLLPGTINAEEEGGLLVRGGDMYETQTFIDGLMVESPYTTKLPGVPVRGRFSPMLFKGMAFSTGGYSAEYGQALSSALVLRTPGLPKKEETNFGMYSIGGHFSTIRKWEKSSFSSMTDYNNLTPYYKLAKSNIDWVKEPRGFNETVVFRQKTGEKGMLKTMATYNYEKSSLYYLNTDTSVKEYIDSRNHNFFGLASYKTELENGWLLHAGISAGSDNKFYVIDVNKMEDHVLTGELKLALKKELTRHIHIKFGGDRILRQYERYYLLDEPDTVFRWGYSEQIQSVFAETEVNITKRITTRIGARTEYIHHVMYFSPRLSLAYNPFNFGQFSVGYGIFTQQPQGEYLIYNNDLNNEKAEHYMINYQLNKNGRTFRIEGYYKKYEDLVKYDSLYAIDPSAYYNRGNGYARGVDIFYRDKSTIRNGDVWIAYSFIDTKRNYKDFNHLLIPGYVAKHNLTLVYKHYLNSIDAYFSVSYQLSSGRPYINPNIDINSQLFTRAAGNLNFNLFYFTRIFKKFTMLHVHVSNVLGADNIYGYRFSKIPDDNGIYESYAIKPAGRRFVIFGIYFTLNGPPEM